mmetsp:Transcript_54942/g.112178  ORF Transcript_54942/g.112178 Transcript_54942/m.112178 type:complete len:822 (+) Transcript_54942:54-2519(+)
MVEKGEASITVKVIKADGVRMHLDKKPDVAVHLRVNVGGNPQAQQKSTAVPSSTSPEWGQTFSLPVKVDDPKGANQLECSLYDESDDKAENKSNFLGEVILNLAKLVPYDGKYIEQVFDIKQGKTAVVNNQKATGKLKLGLTLFLKPPPADGGEAAKKAAPREVPAPLKASAPAPAPAPAAPAAQAPTSPKAKPPASGSGPTQGAPVSDGSEGIVKPSQMRNRGSIGGPAPAPAPAPAAAPPPAAAAPAAEPQPGFLPKVSPTPSTGTLVVSVQSASNLPKVGSRLDPYVILSLEGTRAQPIVARTATKRDTVDPIFDENEILFPVDETYIDAADLNVSLYHWMGGADRNAEDEMVGSLSVKVKDVARAPLGTDFELRNPNKGYAPVFSDNNIPSKLKLSMSYRPPANQQQQRAPAQGPPARVPPAPTAVVGAEESPAGAPRVLQKRPMQTQPVPSNQGPADVGIVLGPGNNNAVVVHQLLPGGPGANVGTIRQGDAIIDVDGHDVVGRGVEEIQGMLYGERNSPVTMIFRRGNLNVPGGEQIVVTLLRAVPGGGRQPNQTPVTQAQAPPNAKRIPGNTQDTNGGRLEDMSQLKRDFNSMSFLWGEPVPDPLLESMHDWKQNILYGPKSDHPPPELPPPPMPSQPGWQPTGMSMDGRSFDMPPPNEFGMRRSFNQLPMPPMYRSFDGAGLQSQSYVRPLNYMRASGDNIPSVRISPPGDFMGMGQPSVIKLDQSQLDGSRFLDSSMTRLSRPGEGREPPIPWSGMSQGQPLNARVPTISYNGPRVVDRSMMGGSMPSYQTIERPSIPMPSSVVTDKNEMVC